MTPRSYSRRILIELSRYSTTMITPTVVMSIISASFRSGTGSTVSFNLSMALTWTRVPAATGRDDTASQYSPWTNTFALGRQVGNQRRPISPTMPAEPVSTLFAARAPPAKAAKR
jgi:hypothetical protein